MYHVVPKETTAKTESLPISGRLASEACTNRKMCKQPVTAHSTKYPSSAAEQNSSSCPVKHCDSKKPVEHPQPKQAVKHAEDRRSQKERSSEERSAVPPTSKPADKQKPKSVCRPPGSAGMSRRQPSLNEAPQPQQSPQSQQKTGTWEQRGNLLVLSGKAKTKTLIGSGVKDYPFPFQIEEIESVEYYDGVFSVCVETPQC